MLRKAITILLTAFLTTQTLANSQHALKPTDCLPEQSCECYLPQDIKKIASGLREREACRHELQLAKKFIKESENRHTPALSWWQEPGVVGGGMVVSFSVGALLMYSAVKK